MHGVLLAFCRFIFLTVRFTKQSGNFMITRTNTTVLVLICLFFVGLHSVNAQGNIDCSSLKPRIMSLGCVNTCEGGSITLDAGDGYADYLWNDGSKTRTIVINSSEASGNYHCLVQSASGCKVATEPVKVTIYPSALKPYVIRQGNKLVSTEAATYRWFYNGKPLPLANTREVVCTEVGDYKVVITNENGCSAASDVTTIDQLAMAQPEHGKDARLRVYPNPSDGRIAVQLLSEFDGDIDYSITDESGKVVMQSTWIAPKVFDILQLDITNQTNGVYFLTALDGVDMVTEKIVKIK